MKKIVIYSASTGGRKALEYLGKDKVLYFCDKDEHKVGTFVEGIEVIDRNNLIEIQDDVDIIVCSSFYKEIYWELKKLGIRKIQRLDITYEIENMQLIEVKEKLSFDSLFKNLKLQGKDKEEYTTSNKKIVFILNNLIIWNNYQSIIESFKKEKNIEVRILVFDLTTKNKMMKKGINTTIYNAYVFKKENPDMVIYDTKELINDLRISFKDIKQNVKNVILIPFDMIMYNSKNYKVVDIKKELFEQFDKVIVNPDFFNKYKNTLTNLNSLGNAKFDIIYRKLHQKSEYPEEWKDKFKGKKVFLWNAVHGISQEGIEEIYSFDLWANKIIEFFALHPEYVLLFRPHPTLFFELLKYRIWIKEDLEKFKLYFPMRIMQ